MVRRSHPSQSAYHPNGQKREEEDAEKYFLPLFDPSFEQRSLNEFTKGD
jgi:hypothetical protein